MSDGVDVFHTPATSNVRLSAAQDLESDPFLDAPPMAPYMASAAITPRSSFTPSTTNSTQLLPLAAQKERSEYAEDPTTPSQPSPKANRRPLLLFALGLIVLGIVVLAVIIPVYFTVIKPKNNHNALKGGSTSNSTSSAGTGTGTGTGNGTEQSSGGDTQNKPTSSVDAVTGGDGSTITMANGQQFTYSNKFSGTWYSDPNDPFNNNAQANSWTPALNQSWTWGEDHIYGVNLGGWFVLEPFISPSLFQMYPGAVDEWSLSILMAADTANGGLNQIETHYQTFITEQDFAQIAGAGLNWIRLPIPFWAIDTWPGEPFLAKTCWKYILQAFEWARKYGLRINLDLHTIPGSQNAFNHSGKDGQVNFLNGVMGLANAQRALNYIRILAEFISQPQYAEVVSMFGVVNEPLNSAIGRQNLRSFYLEAYQTVRNITGQGKGPIISFHDGFQGLAAWADFLPGADRASIDNHPYFAFDGSPSSDPIDTGTGINAGGTWPANACNSWGSTFNTSRGAFGISIAGEFSNGFNDCGLFLNGVGGQPDVIGSCDEWQDSSQWDASTKAGVEMFSKASMDALGDWFFWTWKVGNSSAGIVESPLWSYQLGLQGGWMPIDPRSAVGTCAALGASGTLFDGLYNSWQTDGTGSSISATNIAQYPWPPATISNAPADPADLPMYTPTGTIATLPPPTYTSTSGQNIDAGDGWADAQDTIPAYTAIAGCTYPDAWDAIDVPVPAPCGNVAPIARAAPTPSARRL